MGHGIDRIAFLSFGRSVTRIYTYIHRSVGLSWQARSVGRWLAMYGSLAVAAAGRARVRERDCDSVSVCVPSASVCARSRLCAVSLCVAPARPLASRARSGRLSRLGTRLGARLGAAFLA